MAEGASSGFQFDVPTTEEELAGLIKSIRGNPDLPRVPKPVLPSIPPRTPVRRRLHLIQNYISSFQCVVSGVVRCARRQLTRARYNHTGKLYFNVRKDRGLQRVAATAKDIMAECLPIQCLEAVFLACTLTAGVDGVRARPLAAPRVASPRLPRQLDRFPVSFKTCVHGHVFRHIIMAVRYKVARSRRRPRPRPRRA